MSIIKVALLLLCSITLFAQDDASSEPSYGGPSVLSRGGGPSFNPFSSIKFRPYVGLNGVYYNGLSRVAIDPSGKVPSSNSVGAELSYGVYGKHQWKNTSLSLNYSGFFRHYTQNPAYDGTDQDLTLQLTQRLAKHLTFALGASTGTFSNRFGYSVPIGYYDPSFNLNSANSVFDNRTIFLQTTGRLQYQYNARLSFSFGGSGFLVRRRSSALYGDTGYTANADMTYRVSKFVSLGAYYSYSHYDFLRVFGDSNFHSVGVNLAARLSKRWEFSVSGGVYRLENLLIQTVPVDPVIAAITGQLTGITAKYTLNDASMFNARLSYGFHEGSCAVVYSRGITPGNGVFLTSRQDNAGFDCNYAGQRHWAFNASAYYNSLTAQIQSLSRFRYADVRLGVTRAVVRNDLHFNAQVSAIDYLTNFGAFQSKHLYMASIGFTYSPGERALALW